jgi:hypothetical protein
VNTEGEQRDFGKITLMQASLGSSAFLKRASAMTSIIENQG